MKTIAEHMKDVLVENGTDIVWYGDIEYIEECARRSGMRERTGNTHPLAINNRVLTALDKSPLFKKSYIKHVGRPARCFRLIDILENKGGDLMLAGKVTDAEYSFQRKTYVKPIEHHYESKGEPPYIKYGCPVCEMLQNKHQVTHGSNNCPLCNVNLIWDDDDSESE